MNKIFLKNTGLLIIQALILIALFPGLILNAFANSLDFPFDKSIHSDMLSPQLNVEMVALQTVFFQFQSKEKIETIDYRLMFQKDISDEVELAFQKVNKFSFQAKNINQGYHILNELISNLSQNQTEPIILCLEGDVCTGKTFLADLIRSKGIHNVLAKHIYFISLDELKNDLVAEFEGDRLLAEIEVQYKLAERIKACQGQQSLIILEGTGSLYYLNKVQVKPDVVVMMRSQQAIRFKRQLCKLGFFGKSFLNEPFYKQEIPQDTHIINIDNDFKENLGGYYVFLRSIDKTLKIIIDQSRMWLKLKDQLDENDAASAVQKIIKVQASLYKKFLNGRMNPKLKKDLILTSKLAIAYFLDDFKFSEALDIYQRLKDIGLPLYGVRQDLIRLISRELKDTTLMKGDPEIEVLKEKFKQIILSDTIVPVAERFQLNRIIEKKMKKLDLLLDLGELNQAVKVFKSLKLHKANVTEQEEKLIFLLKRHAEEAILSGLFSRGQNDYLQINELRPQENLVNFYLGGIEYMQGNFKNAQAMFELAKRRDPYSPIFEYTCALIKSIQLSTELRELSRSALKQKTHGEELLIIEKLNEYVKVEKLMEHIYQRWREHLEDFIHSDKIAKYIFYYLHKLYISECDRLQSSVKAIAILFNTIDLNEFMPRHEISQRMADDKIISFDFLQNKIPEISLTQGCFLAKIEPKNMNFFLLEQSI